MGAGSDVLVVKGARGRGRGVLAALLLRGNNGLEVLALSALLAAVAIRGLRDLLGLVDGRLFDVGAIHVGRSPPRAGLPVRGSRECAGGGCAVCSGAPDAAGSAHGAARVRGDLLEGDAGVGEGQAQKWLVVALHWRFLQLLAMGLALPSRRRPIAVPAPDWRCAWAAGPDAMC